MPHHPTAEARDKTAMTSLRLLAVLDVLSSTPARAKLRAPRPDGPLTHFASPRGETCRLAIRDRHTDGRRMPESDCGRQRQVFGKQIDLKGRPGLQRRQQARVMLFPMSLRPMHFLERSDCRPRDAFASRGPWRGLCFRDARGAIGGSGVCGPRRPRQPR